MGLLVRTHANSFLIPLLLKKIPDLGDGDDSGYDGITPYGYGGILLISNNPVAADSAALLVSELRNWCLASQVVSCLIRLHPLLNEAAWFGGSKNMDRFGLHYHGPTVGISMSQWEEANLRISGMRADRKSNLNRARKFLDVVWTNDIIEVESFRAVYDDTMRRLGAEQRYFFPAEYYRRLVANLGDKVLFGFARYEGKIAGAAIFLLDELYAHYHLSGTTDVGRSYKAATLLINDAVGIGRRRGCKLLHLGGGTEGEDELFMFKASFGGSRFSYSFATLVADVRRYEQLTALRFNTTSPVLEREFFPAYRA